MYIYRRLPKPCNSGEVIFSFLRMEPYELSLSTLKVFRQGPICTNTVQLGLLTAEIQGQMAPKYDVTRLHWMIVMDQFQEMTSRGLMKNNSM